MGTFRSRPLDSGPYTYLWLDATGDSTLALIAGIVATQLPFQKYVH